MAHPILEDGEGVAADRDEIRREALRELGPHLSRVLNDTAGFEIDMLQAHRGQRVGSCGGQGRQRDHGAVSLFDLGLDRHRVEDALNLFEGWDARLAGRPRDRRVFQREIEISRIGIGEFRSETGLTGEPFEEGFQRGERLPKRGPAQGRARPFADLRLELALEGVGLLKVKRLEALVSRARLETREGPWRRRRSRSRSGPARSSGNRNSLASCARFQGCGSSCVACRFEVTVNGGVDPVLYAWRRLRNRDLQRAENRVQFGARDTSMNEPLASGTEAAQIAGRRCQEDVFDHAEGRLLGVAAPDAIDLTRAEGALALDAPSVEEGG